MERTSFKRVTAMHIHSDKFAVQILRRDSRGGDGQYRRGNYAALKKARNTPLHRERLAGAWSGNHSNPGSRTRRDFVRRTEALAIGGAEAKRAFDAMMKMKKIDVAAIEDARRG